MTSSSLFYGFSNRKKQLLDFEYIEQDGAEGHQPNDSVLSGFSRAWQKIFYWKIDELQLVSLMPGPMVI